MFKNLFLISCLVFATLLGGVANASHSGLTIEGPPAITCDHMGTYTKYISKNGNSFWSHPIANVARATSAGVVDGLGWATINIDGSVNGRKGSSTLSYRIGTWGTDYTWIWEKSNHTSERKVITSYITGPTSTAVGTYNWDATGYVEAIPYYYEGSLNGAWAAAPKSKIEGSGTGDWRVTVSTKVECGSPNSCTKGRWVDNAYDHRATCSRCGKRYWSCDSYQAYYHERAGLRDCVYCDDRVWYCQTAAGGAHGTTYYCNTCHELHGLCENGCPADGDSSDDSSGTTTSPTVQNNGGGTVGNGGGTGGTSADRVRCGHSNCQRGGWASSREAHKTTCPAGHSYYACSLGGTRMHANCRARNNNEVRCARGSLCRSGGWASSRNAHQTTCGRGHTYWSCWPASVSRHRRH